MRANGVDHGVESFGRDGDPLVLLVGGPTMLSWPDALCEQLAGGGCRVVHYDLPGYTLRDLAAEAAALVDALGAATVHLGGIGGSVAWSPRSPRSITPACSRR